MTFNNNLCLECNIPLELRPGGTRKDGTTYKSFMGCPNFKNHRPKANFNPNTQRPPAPSYVSRAEFDSLKREVYQMKELMQSPTTPFLDPEEEYYQQ